jgi:pimeloyl-ACP methyl ester carboxylesterase
MNEKTSLFLLPGLMCDATVWQDQMSGLEDIALMSVPDFRGHDSLVGMARAVLDQAPARFALAGHSMGGRVALEVYRLAPERVERLALLDTGVHPVSEGEQEKRQVYLDLARSQGMQAVADAWIPPMIHPARQDDAQLLQQIETMVLRTTAAAFEGQIKALLQRQDASPVLPSIGCPCLLLCGRADSWSPPEQHREIGNRIAGAELVIIEGAGHMATMEQPAAVSNALRLWLNRPQPAHN